MKRTPNRHESAMPPLFRFMHRLKRQVLFLDLAGSAGDALVFSRARYDRLSREPVPRETQVQRSELPGPAPAAIERPLFAAQVNLAEQSVNVGG